MLRFAVAATEKARLRPPASRSRVLVRTSVQFRFQSNTPPNPKPVPRPVGNTHPRPVPLPQGRPHGSQGPATHLRRPKPFPTSTRTQPSYVQQYRVGGPGPKQPTSTPDTTAPSRSIKPDYQRLRNSPKLAPSKSSNNIRQVLEKSRASLGSQQKTLNANQSNLGDSGTNVAPASDHSTLVDFFQKRISEHRAAASDAQKKESGTSETSSSSSQRHGLSGLKSAGNEARAVLRDLDQQVITPPGAQSTSPTSEEGEPTIRQALHRASTRMPSNASSSSNITKHAKSTENPSPVKYIIEELRQHRTPTSRPDGASPPWSTTPKTTETPSWRQNLYKQQQQQQEQQGVDQLFASSRIDATPPDEVDDAPKKISRPKSVKDPTIVLPLHDFTLTELSSLFRVKVNTLMNELKKMGEETKDDDSYTIDVDTAEMLALELKLKAERSTRRQRVDFDHNQLLQRRNVSEESTNSETQTDTTSSYASLSPRPPVVCIMGHVDHGKTTLMDALRRRAKGNSSSSSSKKTKGKKAGKKSKMNASDVAGTEAGGITQIISAFQVPLGGEDEAITFLDTPGHAAFSAMRQSGSHAADIIVLVVAADDGVSKQTIEILNFYKSIVKESAGGISMVVAMNKIDKPGINVQEAQSRIENQLLEHGVIAEGIQSHGEGEYGSPVQFFPISAKTGDGLDNLIEGLALQSEIMDLRADDSAKAEGIVMDARVEKGLGVVVDCIIRWGSMERSDVVVSGTHCGKVKILKDVNDKTLKKGLPSQPVRIIGFQSPPKAGDPIACVSSEEAAEELIARRIALKEKRESSDLVDSTANFSRVIVSGRESMTQTWTEQKLEKYDLNFDGNGSIRIPVIVKADADGSVAAVCDSLVNLGAESTFDIFVDPIQVGVGPLTSSDIAMAKESSAAVFCFGLKTQEKSIMSMAAADHVPIRQYDVIYSLIDDAKEIFTEYLPLSRFETVHGKAKVQDIFTIKGKEIEQIAGLKVLDGYLYRNETSVNGIKLACHYRVLRKGELVSPEDDTVKAASLRRFKDSVDSVRGGDECGLGLSGFSEFQEGDVIECYSVEMRQVFA